MKLYFSIQTQLNFFSIFNYYLMLLDFKCKWSWFLLGGQGQVGNDQKKAWSDHIRSVNNFF